MKLFFDFLLFTPEWLLALWDKLVGGARESLGYGKGWEYTVEGVQAILKGG